MRGTMAIDAEELGLPEGTPEEQAPTLLERLVEVVKAANELRHDAKHAFMSWARQSGYQASYKDLAVLGMRKKRRP